MSHENEITPSGSATELGMQNFRNNPEIWIKTFHKSIVFSKKKRLLLVTAGKITLILKGPMTTTADDKFCNDTILDFQGR